MKRVLSVLLILILALSVLPAAAFADGPAVVLSPQKLRVDGRQVACEKYNIDGSNYFKLRDIALVLSGTGSRFSVGWDGEKKVISIVTGEEYEPNGSELDLSGGDKSATAAPSTQTLLINGVERGDLSAYNIGGNNFFKLRDLGDALGFRVDYDGGSNTAVVVSRVFSQPRPWLTEETVFKRNGAEIGRNVSTYAQDGQLLSLHVERNYMEDDRWYSYDELGRETGYGRDYVNTAGAEPYEEHFTGVLEYDIWGNLVKSTEWEGGEVSSESVMTYDELGQLVRDEIRSGGSVSVYSYSRDESGLRRQSEYSENGVLVETYVFDLDKDGNVIRQEQRDAGGKVLGVFETVYENGRETETRYTGNEDWYVERWQYDGNGNQTLSSWEDDEGVYATAWTYDAAGRVTEEKYSSEGYSYLYVNVYSPDGLLLRQEYSDSEGDGTVEEFTYDGEGRCLTAVLRGDGYSRTSSYAYDLEACRMTVVIDET